MILKNTETKYFQGNMPTPAQGPMVNQQVNQMAQQNQNVPMQQNQPPSMPMAQSPAASMQERVLILKKIKFPKFDLTANESFKLLNRARALQARRP